MKTRDEGRKWIWWFLGVGAALQVYFVQEVLAAFALFAIAFMAIALVIGSLYMLCRFWAAALDRFLASRYPVMAATRQGIDAIEDMARQPFGRPGSVAAR